MYIIFVVHISVVVHWDRTENQRMLKNFTCFCLSHFYMHWFLLWRLTHSTFPFSALCFQTGADLLVFLKYYLNLNLSGCLNFTLLSCSYLQRCFKFTSSVSLCHLSYLFSPSLFPVSLPLFWSFVVLMMHQHSGCVQPEIDINLDKQEKDTNMKIDHENSRVRCEGCEGLIEMDQSKRVSGTPYF